MKRRLLVCVIALGLVPTILTAGTQEALVLPEVTVIDGNGGPPLPHMTLVIADGRITDLFASGEKPLPPESAVLDVCGQYVIPGLIDTHVHLTLTPEALESRLAMAVHGGVTAVRDMGGDTAWLAGLSDTTASPTVRAPRVYFAVALAGPTMVGMPRSALPVPAAGFSMIPWLSTVTVHTPIPRAVGFIKSTGATGLKVYSDVPFEVIRGFATEAHRQGLKVWAHARVFPGTPSDLITAGVDVISHSSLLACEVSRLGSSCDHRAPVGSESLTRLFTLMRSRGTILEPTLAVQQRISLAGGADLKRHGSAPLVDFGIEATRLAHRLGVRIAAGSDLPLEPGGATPRMHDELELLVTQAGLTPLEAITAATRTGAEVLGIEGSSGTIAIGKRADVVVLADDPSRDIRNTRRITYVLKAGIVSRRRISH